jgi:hypothetical protein
VAPVVVERSAEDKDIIQIDNGKVIQEIAEDVVHQVLEGGWGVYKAKWHDPILVVTVSRSECRLPLVALGDADEVVAGTEIDLGEDGGGSEAVEELVDQRERIAVFDGHPVETAIVDTQAQRAVAFLHEQDGSAGGRRRSLDVTFGQVLSNVLIERFELNL